MKKRTILFIVLISCALGVCAEDSIKVSARDLQSLIQRVERLEKVQRDKVQSTKESPQIGNVDAVSGASKKVQSDKGQSTKDTVKVQSEKVQSTKDMRGRFTIGGYGEVTAKHCWYSNNYLRYGKNPERSPDGTGEAASA